MDKFKKKNVSDELFIINLYNRVLSVTQPHWHYI
jgi:hypothetical protein